MAADGGARAGGLHRVLGIADRAILKGWRLFKSIYTGIFLLVCIAAVCVWGTMGYASNPALGDNNIPMARALVFQSPWFAGLLALFGIQLVLSTWHVTVMSLTIWWKREFRDGASFYAPGMGGAPRARIEGARMESLLPVLGRRFTRTAAEGTVLFAQRGLLSRMGPTVIHFGMIVILMVGLVRYVLMHEGHIISEGRFIVAEGEAYNGVFEPIELAQAVGGGNVKVTEMPGGKYIRLLDFQERQHANVGSPAYFSSLIEIVDPASGTVTVRQLDMNHSTHIDGLQYHQAGYEAIQEEVPSRFNFDVRDRRSGERVAVVDLSARVPNRIGDTDFFLRVDRMAPGANWVVYDRAQPTVPKYSGLVQGSAEKSDFTFEVVKFYPDFKIDREKREPYNASNEPVNPAVQVVSYINGQANTAEWIFYNKELAAQIPAKDPVYAFSLDDVMVRADAGPGFDPARAGDARFVIGVRNQATGRALEPMSLVLGERSAPLEYVAPGAAPNASAPESAGPFLVTLMGPATRYLTVLSVIRDPTTHFFTAGVVVILIGALMTFATRYEALYGRQDDAGVSLALIPRWGRSNDQSRLELEKLLSEIQRETGLEGVLLSAPTPTGPATAEPETISAPQVLTKA